MSSEPPQAPPQSPPKKHVPKMADRFRGYLPVVIDVETAGFNPQKDAFLEIATVLVDFNEVGVLERKETVSFHVKPFEGANLDPSALEFTGIDPYHPFRFAVNEKEALQKTFDAIKKAMKATKCQKAILVGHNGAFDLSFIKAAAKRAGFKKTPFHPFSTIDTVSLSALAVGQTVLARSVKAAGLPFDTAEAHSAIYDAEKTADLFCQIVNQWEGLGGWDNETNKPVL